MTAKEEWTAEVAAKLLAQCPYPFMSIDGVNLVPAAVYSAQQAKVMADTIFGV